MPRDARQMTPRGPPPVAIHDYRNVIRQALGIEFGEKLRFLAAGGL
jgi:hypothetical protein